MQHSSNLFIALAILTALVFGNWVWYDWQNSKKPRSIKEEWYLRNKVKKP